MLYLRLVLDFTNSICNSYCPGNYSEGIQVFKSLFGTSAYTTQYFEYES